MPLLNREISDQGINNTYVENKTTRDQIVLSKHHNTVRLSPRSRRSMADGWKEVAGGAFSSPDVASFPTESCTFIRRAETRRRHFQRSSLGQPSIYHPTRARVPLWLLWQRANETVFIPNTYSTHSQRRGFPLLQYFLVGLCVRLSLSLSSQSEWLLVGGVGGCWLLARGPSVTLWVVG